MKRILKAVARRGWRLTSPVRRPFARKVAGHLARAVATVLRDEVHPRLDGVVQGLSLIHGDMAASSRDLIKERRETNLLIDGLVREISRLQEEVESLQLLIQETHHGRGFSGRIRPENHEATAA